ncbi:MAG: class I SAM-dependent methyltransferase family protein [Thaumarchaeota archaeon]|nr:class I SAM-dependent methyltransferase family protein [Nitrososphaerota archaeon]
MPRLIRQALEDAGVRREPSTGVDVIGDIAIVRLSGFTRKEKKGIARSLLDQIKNVRGVFEQEGGIEGEYRLRKLRYLAGEEKTLTLHRENRCLFKVDVAKCYFTPRLSTERLRIASQVKPRERVLNMFAGVGPYSIPIAKIAGAKVVSCELSAYACQLHEGNNRLNKVEKLVRVLNLDAAELPKATDTKFDRVLMPHPSQADRFFPTAIKVAKKGGRIHYYRHVLGRNEAEASMALDTELSGLLPAGATYKARKVRTVGPRWVELVADVKLRS